MAEIKSKQATDRTPLETVIPLETPYVVQLAVSSACNYKCKYCPASEPDSLKSFGVTKGLMPFDLFCKIVDDLADFPEPIRVLRLVKEGEPLLNKRLPDMIRYAKRKQPDIPVDTTTNGHLLTPETSDRLLDAGLDRILISLQGITDEAYKRVAGVDVVFETIFDNVRYFCERKGGCRVYVKVPDVGVTEDEAQAFYTMFTDLADEMFVERMVPTWPDFDFSTFKEDDGVGYYGQPILADDVTVCSLVFYAMTINHDGTVPPCVFDWRHICDLDDVRQRGLYDIWNGKPLNDFRRAQLRGERWKIPLCANCKALQYCNVDVIDDHAAPLLAKFGPLP